MALTAILAATALLGYGAMLAEWRLNAAARQVVMDLKVARAQAIVEAVNHRLYFPAPATSYEHQRRAQSRRYAPLGAPISLPRGIEIIGCTAAGSGISFHPRGHVSTFGTITLRNDEGIQRQIVIDIAGRMRVQ